MKKILSIGGGIVALALILSFVLPAKPAEATTPNWNVTGSYVVSFDGYNHDMTIVGDGLGNVVGSGGYPATGPYTHAWTITSGQVSADTINLTADYTLGAIGTTMHMTGTVAPNGTMSGTWDDNNGGITRTGSWTTISGVALALPGTLIAQDFGVVSYDTGLGMLKGYTSGFGVTDNTLAGATSVVVKLYAAGDVLLQTNTAILSKFNADITGTEFSSPFDVSGTFAYATDGYWTNVKETQYGQSVPATKVVATVTLANGKVVTATNTNLTGDPTTIYPVATVDTAPIISGVPVSPVSIPELALYTFDVNAIDTDVPVQTLTFSLSAGAPAGATINSSTGVFSWTPTEAQGVGSYTFNVMVTDGTLSDSEAITINVTEVGDPIPTTPTTKNQCKNGGWMSFTVPTFKNQGSCIAWVNNR